MAKAKDSILWSLSDLKLAADPMQGLRRAEMQIFCVCMNVHLYECTIFESRLAAKAHISIYSLFAESSTGVMIQTPRWSHLDRDFSIGLNYHAG
jgi:hypothetical protein